MKRIVLIFALVAVSGLVRAEMHTWTLKDGKSLDAEYVLQLGDKTVLKTAKGKEIKVLTNDLSADDLDYLELINPPKLKLTFKQETNPVYIAPIPNGDEIPTVNQLAIGVSIDQKNPQPYTRKLVVELFSIASEYDGDNFILLDRQKETFTLTPENGRHFEIWGKKAYLRQYYDPGQFLRGEKFKGFMIVVTDERGEIIATNITNDWFLDIIDSLRQLPVGRYFNKAGERVFPPRPKFSDRFWNMDV
jgi:hypothetical protein